MHHSTLPLSPVSKFFRWILQTRRQKISNIRCMSALLFNHFGKDIFYTYYLHASKFFRFAWNTLVSGLSRPILNLYILFPGDIIFRITSFPPSAIKKTWELSVYGCCSNSTLTSHCWAQMCGNAVQNFFFRIESVF
jgi:hypothetical protein